MSYASCDLITRCERDILNVLNWNLESYPTFFSVLELFRAQGVLFDTDFAGLQPSPPLNLVPLVDKYLDLFSLMSL